MAEVLADVYDVLDVELSGQSNVLDVSIDTPGEPNVDFDGETSVSVWGNILGNINNQKDLMQLIEDKMIEVGGLEPIPISYIESLE